MVTSTEKPRPVLHIWPKTDFSLSLDPACIASLLYLQTYIPGQFDVEFCANPDLSPSGQLPFLSHGLHTVAGFHGIVKYLSTSYHIDPSASLDAKQKAQLCARLAHVESSLGDLTSHVLYSLSANWAGSTQPALVSILPVPQKYYLPERIRRAHQPRLEAVELWDIAAIEQEEKQEKERFSFKRPARKNKKAEEKAKFRETLQRNKVLDKARAVLSVYSDLLGDAAFLYGAERPTTLDILLAAHIYLLTRDQPDNLIKDLIVNEYPKLTAHADAIYELAFPDPSNFPVVVSSQTNFTLSSLFPQSTPQHPFGPKSAAALEQERRFAIMRGAFFSGAFLVAGAYIYHQRFAFVDLYHRLQLAVAIVSAQYGLDEDEEEDEDEDEDEDEEVEGVEEDNEAEGEGEADEENEKRNEEEEEENGKDGEASKDDQKEESAA